MRTLKLAGARAAACLLATFVAAPASAQQSGADARQSPPDQLTIERVKHSFVIAPDFKVTTVDDRFSKLLGAYAGWVSDETLLLGGGGYWLTNPSRDLKMGYGGLVVEWRVGATRPVALSGRGLVGVGEATLSSRLSGLQDQRFSPRRPNRPMTAPVGVIRFNDQFFIAEPQLNVLVRMTKRLQLNSGVGYRVIGGADGLGNRLRGATGSIGLQFGIGS
jgi:hypothetical protein